jgi:hypothetical protein
LGLSLLLYKTSALRLINPIPTLSGLSVAYTEVNRKNSDDLKGDFSTLPCMLDQEDKLSVAQGLSHLSV